MAHLIGSVSLGSNVYSMRDIAKYEQINKERIENLMKQTLSKAVSSSENKSPAVIQVFFNEVGVYDTNINAFIRHSRLEPFAKAIRLKIEKCRRGNGEINYAMFYVPKKVYEDWRKRHIAYNAAVAQCGRLRRPPDAATAASPLAALGALIPCSETAKRNSLRFTAKV